MFRSAIIALSIGSLLFHKPAHQFGWSDMVQPLAWTSMIMDMEEGAIEMKVKNHCTAWSYRSNEKLHWITAGHCVLNEDGSYDDEDYQVQGSPVYVEDYDYLNDIASLTPDLDNGVPGHQIAKDEPAVDNDPRTPSLIVRGHPLGYDALFTTFGYMSVLAWHDPQDKDGVIYNVYQVPIAGGNSGSPVYDREGKVVGLLQIGWGWGGFSSVSGGLPLAKLKAFLSELP